MNLLSFRYFKILAQYENVTKASNYLRISQPSLSNMLLKLESELGYQLFDRVGKRISINENGKIFLKYVDSIFKELTNAQNELDEYNNNFGWQLSLATNNCIFTSLWMTDFLCKNPNVKVKEQIISGKAMMDSLISGELDFTITNFKIDNELLTSQLIGIKEYVIIVSKNNPLSNYDALSFYELSQEPFVATPSEARILRFIDDISNKANIIPKIIFEGETMLLLDAAKTLNALMVHVNFCLPNPCEFHAINLTDSFAKMEIYLTWNVNRYKNNACRMFLSHMENYFE
ncbi:LysR family transcriptional regulator [Dehalobacterium formicoaceticum]|uniref:LysR family transcriptional regulator n=1 Tax=Dehalobacterium formicoaceticum TaxID=51515 RepID=UPI0031F6D5BA